MGAYWNNKLGGYDVTVRDLALNKDFQTHCDVLINAGGILNNWRWPAIPGIEKYKGNLLHTANWDDNIDLRGLHVGLIGNGCVYTSIEEKKIDWKGKDIDFY
jgi:cation diffusion facilitator CzcD-associated flavoprotein CzcO